MLYFSRVSFDRVRNSVEIVASEGYSRSNLRISELWEFMNFELNLRPRRRSLDRYR